MRFYTLNESLSMHSNDHTCARPHTPEVSLNSNSLIVYLIALGAFSLGMASYVTAGLIPMIREAFDLSTGVAAQLVTAFTLAYGIGSPVVVAFLSGRAQRNGLFAALGLFVISNAASAIAKDFSVLLIFRALAGVGAGVYLAIGITTVTSLSPFGRGKAIAMIMAGMASGTVLGVPFGLVLAEQFGWGSVFWLLTLLGGVAFIGLFWRLPALPMSKNVSLKMKMSLLVDGQVLMILSVSLLAAISSIGMYTFLAPLIASPQYGDVDSITPYLWIWGIGGIVGSFTVGCLAEYIKAPLLTLLIMLILSISLFLLPIISSWESELALIPIAIWGAVGWALQVPQNNKLIHIRESNGDGNLAVALNESALYLGSAIGTIAGGMVLISNMPIWSLPVGAGMIAALGALVQLLNMKTSGK